MHSLGSSNLSFTTVIQVLREFRITIFHIFFLISNKRVRFMMQK